MYESLGPVQEQTAPHAGMTLCDGSNISKARIHHDFWTLVIANWPTGDLVDGSLRKAGLYLAENGS